MSDTMQGIMHGTKYSEEIDKFIKDLNNRIIEIIPILECKRDLFELAKQEAIQVTNNMRPISTWNIPEMTFCQYNLYNKSDSFLDELDDLDTWDKNKKFNSKLVHIPNLILKYFPNSKIQNCRLLTVNHLGALGMHSERILGIKNNEKQYKLRFHIPFSTSHETKFYMNEKYYLLDEGVLYFYNQYCQHGVDNTLGLKRAHLVFDIFLDKELIQKYLI